MNVQAKIATADPASIARKMLVDPADCFNRSYAAMHGMDRSTLEAVQLAGLKLRFAALRNAIPTLKKLADEAGVHEIRVLVRSMMWTPLRTPNRYGFILGFQRRVW